MVNGRLNREIYKYYFFGIFVRIILFNFLVKNELRSLRELFDRIISY